LFILKRGYILVVFAGALLLAGLLLLRGFRARAVPASAPGHGYTVYLTFDDGPSKNTEAALDVLKAQGVRGTFFVIAQADEYELSLYKRIIWEGHALGLHSYTHDMHGIYASTAAYIDDFERVRDWLLESTGISTHICRMVGGGGPGLCSKAMRNAIVAYFDENGYACYNWDIDPRDSGAYPKAADTIARNIIDAARKKPDQDLVILLHDDRMRRTLAQALEIIIPYFRERGYDFGVLGRDTVLDGSRARMGSD